MNPPQTDLPLQFERMDLGEEASCRSLYELLRDTQTYAGGSPGVCDRSGAHGRARRERMWQINVAGTARVMEAVTEANRQTEVTA
jgi:hypothetical protein